MLREKLADALKQALESNDKRRAATLRLISAAIKDRETAAREQGRDGVSEEEVLNLLRHMVDQRMHECVTCEKTGNTVLALQEQQEADLIREFLPPQLSEYEVRLICKTVVDNLEAKGLRDMGRCMSVLKDKYPGQMDFAKASCVVKELLRPAAQ
ncbi:MULTISPECIES: GatB/YqeY domain-containing protein [Pseudovibrio]|uniref:GatB/YqeY domain-containing protein n=1 Tax=Stappiaceae TaxID=2821832 RepID=UPI002366A188|nr:MULTISPECIES: GatB/YqeY domain-containing protein [Pseudovibrio]MDD7910252.1 GatB/YqeY domain-containing protein [Pseudovibrio exalbescens]MDX5593966.1 GatB/YqeY domain-containing protein [Pseudovibrio sp. SPO723]